MDEAEIFYLDTFLGNIGGFKNGCNKVVIELRVVQLWSEIILVISNQTRAIALEIMRMISDQNCTPLSSIYYQY